MHTKQPFHPISFQVNVQVVKDGKRTTETPVSSQSSWKSSKSKETARPQCNWSEKSSSESSCSCLCCLQGNQTYLFSNYVLLNIDFTFQQLTQLWVVTIFHSPNFYKRWEVSNYKCWKSAYCLILTCITENWILKNC